MQLVLKSCTICPWRLDNAESLAKLCRISAEVFANKLASTRVLEKAGFVFETRLKKNLIKDGQLLDSLLYAKDEVGT